MINKTIHVGSDFSGCGAFIQALIRLNINFKEKFACDINKYSRQTYLINYEKPESFPYDVYDRKIPEKSLDIYMTSPPCQAFSFAGKRLGEDDERGVLFYNSHEFIQKNKPRFFIFENVKGLISDDKKNPKDKIGRTFRRWLDFLGGKSVNGNQNLFPHEKSVPYHIYWKVLNSKHFGVPQNRERVFIIGIRDDEDNNFSFPKRKPLKFDLKKVIEENVDEKYFLSNELQEKIKVTGERRIEIIDSEFPLYKFAAMRGRYLEDIKSRKPGLPTTQIVEVKNNEDVSNTITTVQKDNLLVIYSANKKGYEIAEEGDIVSYNFIKSKTHRGRVGKKYSKTVCAKPTQGFVVQRRIRRLTPRESFRLMDFDDSFRWECSESQAYNQAGNSIVVQCLVEIINKFNL